MSCQKEMYNLAKSKTAPKMFLYFIISRGFFSGACGYYFSKEDRNEEFVEKMEYFKEECGKLSKVGIQIAKMITGKESFVTKNWIERNQDLDVWCKNNLTKSSK